jgi:transcriptional regulator with XRE-family HTH domain
MKGSVLEDAAASALRGEVLFERTCPVVADVDGVRLLLHARRLRGRMTLIEASRRAGLNRDELSRLEKGETMQVRFSTIAKLLVVYGCTLDDLVEVERVPAASPLYAAALAALEAGALEDRGPRRRAVRRDAGDDLIAEGEEATSAQAADDAPRRRRSAVGTVHR